MKISIENAIQTVFNGEGDIIIVRKPRMEGNMWKLFDPNVENVTVSNWNFIMQGRQGFLGNLKVLYFVIKELFFKKKNVLEVKMPDFL